MIDTSGHLVFYMDRVIQSNPPYPVTIITDFKLQPDNQLCFNSNIGPGNRVYFRMDSTFLYTDTLDCDLPQNLDLHDLFQTPDGHFHFFCSFDTLMDLSGILTNNGDSGMNPGTVKVQKIIEKNAAGAVLWEWNPLDHISINDINSAYFTDTSSLDLTHYNSIDVDASGNYLISSRNIEEVIYIDKATGNIIWRMGGSQNQFSLVNDSVWFSGQHYARFLSETKIGLYDNATQRPSGIARGIEYEVDTISMTATVGWKQETATGMNSLFTGSYQVLPDSHRLIDWGGMTPFNQSFAAEEFRDDHSLAMQLDLTGSFSTYRALKFVLPWELNRPVISCNPSSSQLEATPGFSHYYWSNGDSGISIVPSDTGWYQVWVDKGRGRLSSEPFYVADAGNPCGLAAISFRAKSTFRLYPNPANTEVNLIGNYLVESNYQISIFNSWGVELLRKDINCEGGKMNVSLSTTELVQGIYVVELRGEKSRDNFRLGISR
jgi:Arylsulfotransferase (ASST)/Secretion system C-terminal sorting domain